MASSEHLASVLLQQLSDFIVSQFALELSEAQEDPHVFAFWDYCVNRPMIYNPVGGKRIQGPIRSTLPVRVYDLMKHSHRLGRGIQVSRASIAYARELANRFETRSKGARSVSPAVFRILVRKINTKHHYGKRLKAMLLCIAKLWARPGEVLVRNYPDDVRPDYDQGIALVIPRSKTNPGPRPEIIGIAHEVDTEFCAVCALREWIDWLEEYIGHSYRGPLFLRCDGAVSLGTR